MSQPPDIWDFFDRIYCISLDERHDRRQQAREQFAAAGLLERVEFVLVAKHPENREKGIFESHMSCLKKGLAAGARRIMVFEDDLFFRHFDPRALREACAQLESLGTWNAFFLGAITRGSRRTGSPSLVKIKYRCLAHAYALNGSFAQRLVREEWNQLPFDELLRQNQSDFFALHPMTAFQGLSGSDNQTVIIDRLRRLFGGLPFIQKVNEFYQNHKALCLAAHLTLLGVIGLLAYKLW